MVDLLRLMRVRPGGATRGTSITSGRIYGFVLVATTALLGGCGGGLPSSYDRAFETQGGVSTKVGNVTAFYVTNRRPPEPRTAAAEAYLWRRDAGLHYGTCAVKVPAVHNIGGDVVSEQLSRVWDRPQPGHFEVVSTSPTEPANDPAAAAAAFYESLKTAAGDPPRDVLILVHGYNNSFAGPVARAAELAYDLGGGMVPVAYCWSSQGQAQGYPHDENDVDLAGRQLAVFVRELRVKLPDARLHLIAHSMGSRVTTLALARLKDLLPARPLQNLVFAAADIDADEFEARMVDDGLKDLAGRTTLYAAWNDHALQASEALHGRNYPRAGRAGDAILAVGGIDTVDVSLNDASFVGHSYFGDNRAVIQDLFLLLVHDAAPQKRNLYQAVTVKQNKHPGAKYWLIRP